MIAPVAVRHSTDAVERHGYRRLMDGPWNDSDDDQDVPAASRSGGAYPLPEATIAGDGGFLAGLAAAILGILLFWRKKRPAEDGQ